LKSGHYKLQMMKNKVRGNAILTTTEKSSLRTKWVWQSHYWLFTNV